MTQINFVSVQALYTPLTVATLQQLWPQLHSGDREPWPQSEWLQQAWLAFHNGQFQLCAEMTAQQPSAATVRLKALNTYAHYLETDPAQKRTRLIAVSAEAELALGSQPTNANLAYQLAYSLGRYGQFISVTQALVEGLAGRVASALQMCLREAPEHADAHTAYAAYQAAIIGKLGKLAARLSYAVSVDSAVRHFQRAIELAPVSITAKTEYADGLLTLFGRKRRSQVIELYLASVAEPPLDALSALDYYLAQQQLHQASITTSP